jgi:hypothetical protein
MSLVSINVNSCHSCHLSFDFSENLVKSGKPEGGSNMSSWAFGDSFAVMPNATSRCPYCAFGFHCKFTGMRSFKLCLSCQIISFMSNHVIHVKSCHSCQIMSFMPNNFIPVKSCYSCQIMSFMSNHVIHVKSCHSFQIMSNHVICGISSFSCLQR